ncbi:MAG: hypothetical protein LBB13_00030, partial [Rickettsiales bacterium]|nr:hypothetical protein [Rickettsiales bacterium]
MKISEKSKIYCQCVSLFFRSVLVASIVFSTVAMAGAETAEVSSFEELQMAIGNNSQNYINVKQDIPFTNEIVINRSNLTISGPSENAPGLLDGRNNHKLLTFGESAKNISLKNLHLSNGNNKDTSNASNGGGAIHLNAGVVVNLEGLTFS